jgi:hypothetical protein
MRRCLVAAGLAAVLLSLGGASALNAGTDRASRPKTAISLTTALTFFDPPGCDFTPQRPCADIGSFTANDQATADLLCPAGSMAESYYFPPEGSASFTTAERTLTCPDGSTLLMHVERVEFTDLTPTTALIGETWRVRLGTGRFSLLSGKGKMAEVFGFGTDPGTLGGSLTGTLRSARAASGDD